MNELEQGLRAAAEALDSLGRRFAVVGGLAVSARAEPRLTRDADLAVLVDSDDDAEALIHDLRAVGYEATAIVVHEAAGRLATARLRGPRDQPTITDLLFASSGIEPEIVAEAEQLRILPDLELPVATVGHLMAMKLLARDDRRRPADADDLAGLAEVASAEDWATAERAVELIEQRGYARGRDLSAALRRVQEHGAYD